MPRSPTSASITRSPWPRTAAGAGLRARGVEFTTVGSDQTVKSSLCGRGTRYVPYAAGRYSYRVRTVRGVQHSPDPFTRTKHGSSPGDADRITDPTLGLTHVAHHTPRRCALGNTACPRGTNEPQTPASFGDNSSALKQPAAGITWHRRHAAGPPRSAVSPQNVGRRLPDDGFPLRGCSTPRVSIRRSGGGIVIHRRA